RRVGRELEALAIVELLDRADEADRALLDEVEQRQALPLLALGHRDDEPQVRGHHALLGDKVTALDALGEHDLVLAGEQGRLADVVEEPRQDEAVLGFAVAGRSGHDAQQTGRWSAGPQRMIKGRSRRRL